MRQRDHLVYMANQIARNFESMGDADPAAATAEHIALYWEPRMRSALTNDFTGLTSIAAEAFARLAARRNAAGTS